MLIATNVQLYGMVDLLCALMIAGLEVATLGLKTPRTEKILLYLVLLAQSAICVLDFFWVLIDGNKAIPVGLNYLVNCCYFASSFALAYLWVYFVGYIVNVPEIKQPLWRNLLGWPIFISVVLVFTAPLNGYIFSITEAHVYQRGTLYMLQPLMLYAYLVVGAIITVFHTTREKMAKSRSIDRAFVLFIIPPIAGGIYQIYHPGMPVMNALITFSLVYIYIILQQQRNRDQSDIIMNLSEDYREIGLVDLHTGKIKPFRGEMLFASLQNEGSDGMFFDDAVSLFSKGYISPIDRDLFIRKFSKENLREELKNKKSFVFNLRIRINKASADYQYTQIKVVSLDEGKDKVNNLIVAIRDIDAELKKEKEIQDQLETAKLAADAANRTKSAFLFNMSHDIRTPMNAVLGFTAMAKKNVGDEEKVMDCLDKVEGAGVHLLSLINDVLDMARIESGKVKLEVKPVNVVDAAHNLVNMIDDMARDKRVTFTYNFDDVQNANVYADALHVNQILLNVISNAIKYTKEGGSVSYVINQIDSESEGISKYNFVVTDTGIGMSEEFQKHIFDTFEREASSSVSGIQGTGLGMAITKQLVEIMGGDIKVESKLGWGTTVTVTLAFENYLGEVEKVVDTTAEYHVDLNGKKVLLVEDNELNREIAREILDEVGIIVEEAVDGEMAVEKVSTSNPGDFDLILMDIQMPKMNGYEAATAIRNLADNALASIPILAMTANAFEEDKQNALKAGMDGHLAKPIDVDKLMEAIAMVTKN